VIKNKGTSKKKKRAEGKEAGLWEHVGCSPL